MNRNVVAVAIVLLIVIAGGIWLITAAEDITLDQSPAPRPTQVIQTPQPTIQPSPSFIPTSSPSATPGRKTASPSAGLQKR